MENEEIIRMPIADFRAEGYLSEVNRRVLHPLGLALEVRKVDGDVEDWLERVAPAAIKALADAGTYTAAPRQARAVARAVLDVLYEDGAPTEILGGVWDYRDDPEGIVMADSLLPVVEENAAKIAQLWNDRAAPRLEKLGYMIQPVGSASERTFSASEVRAIAFQAAGAGTRPLMQDHPDYVFPSERVSEAVNGVLGQFGVEGY